MSNDPSGGDRLAAYDFVLPKERIAQAPVVPRDAARLLVICDALQDRRVCELPELLRPGDLLVLNDTRVLPTRFWGRRGDVAIEATLVEPAGADAWWALCRPGKRLRCGEEVELARSLAATVEAKDEAGRIRLRFRLAGEALRQAIRAEGAMPLPPYIRRAAGVEAIDRERYQSVFARRDGSVAAPTASLHFTSALLDRLQQRGIARSFVTLHVGEGTFTPIKTDPDRHRMHEEWFEIPPATADAIATARARGGRIVCCGTTVLRALESAADAAGRPRSGAAVTRLFIRPGWRFRTADLLLTNFHMPRSTLFMLVCAFGGTDRLQAAYRHAIAAGYRFFSYGDATLIAPARSCA